MNFLSYIKAIARANSYRIYTRPFELNIWGIRSENTLANRFDDAVHVFFKRNQFDWTYKIYPATTDPGTFWLNNPIQPQGTAILKEGQYVNAYQIGMHLGKYLALVQRKPVTVFRDYDRNGILSFGGIQTTGPYGINIHRAMVNGTTRYVDKHSAGCQVFADAGNFLEFMKLCERHSSLFGNWFTYTLVDHRELRKAALRKVLLGTAGALALGTGVLAYQMYVEKQNKSAFA